jgi:condensin complex subunit 1
VSSAFCEAHHKLLFKILETSRDANVRANVVIALGDVAVSFGTIVDENSSELYKGLTDKNLIVKKNTLMVLTHLILNGMIKVKGQLGEMAKCVEDEDKRIEDLAKLFFKELSTKDNAIYNNLPDGMHQMLSPTSRMLTVYSKQLSVIFLLENMPLAKKLSRVLCDIYSLISKRYFVLCSTLQKNTHALVRIQRSAKRRTLSKNSVSVSVCRTSHVNGGM